MAGAGSRCGWWSLTDAFQTGCTAGNFRVASLKKSRGAWRGGTPHSARAVSFGRTERCNPTRRLDVVGGTSSRYGTPRRHLCFVLQPPTGIGGRA